MTTLTASIPTYAEPIVHKVEIKDFTFIPYELVVKTGDIIEFRNGDYAPHTATATDHSFDTKKINKDVEIPIVAEKPGVYSYRCSFHPTMKGKIVVE